ncbi:MAG: phosphoheptose isomerase [Candidatus Colwellbacteria bacterium CG10_big_fil_rev_8_21_14_0_10_42_22]|uniref:Phosphoheptose isomerase n=1 Tax=Candidatus Colwellbacteria bacterium CG10_big_fil_rev_8_21_14_0_10_42_22 TaxID=1974540 RepID=A0A2H0VGP2_9BACT|nr:MAG: phosphoheptose isomerase [Candidatus Colwellbacteria bacterium CG10_big_fil_rev_8_21_14_0_10_42_22]
MKKTTENYLRNHVDVMTKVVDVHADTIVEIANAVIDCYKNNGQLVLFGNGGSAADAQHIAGELIGRYTMERKSLPAVALNTNVSIMTALSNDYYYHSLFERQVEGVVRPGDVVIGISTSGNAGNVIRGILKAREMGAKTIGFTGESGGELKDKVDILLNIPSNVTGHIQEAHIAVGHIMCELVEIGLFKPTIFE